MNRNMRAAALAIATLMATAASVAAMSLGSWSTAVSVESIPGTSGNLNTAALEGCAFVAQRDDTLYFASNRAGGQGGLDVWYALRQADGTWGDPVNFAAVNSPYDEFCPTAHRNGKTFLFVSNRPGGCGGEDIYATRLHTTKGWAPAQNLGCSVNSSGNEAGPSLLETELYFSSTRPGGFAAEAPGATPDADIYVALFDGSAFAAPMLAPGLNTAQNDFRPNLRRDELEVFFDSNRPGGFGGLDLWTATRASAADGWGIPVNLGSSVNSAANDLRATLSWDARALYFGSLRAGGEGSQDLYIVTR